MKYRVQLVRPVLLIAISVTSGAAPGSGPALTASARSTTEVPAKILAKTRRESVAVRPDQPGSAARHAALKRRVPPGGPDLGARMAAARAARSALDVHSLRLGGVVQYPQMRSAVTESGRAFRKSVGTWESLGPGNIGGRSRTIAIRNDNPDVMYLGGVSGGVWKTTDGGALWRAVSDDLANIAVNAMAMDPADPDTLYIGTGEGYFREEVRGTWLPLRGEGIFKTTDGGATWTQLPATVGDDFHWVNDLVISPHARQRIYAATRSGVWRSPDGGESWEKILAEEAKGGCLDLAIRTDIPGDRLFASCGTLDQSSVYRNLDAAATDAWERVLSEPGMGRTSLAIAPSNQDIVYALAAAHGGSFDMGLHAVFRSDSGGSAGSWEARVRGSDEDKVNTLILTNPAAASYVECGWASSNSWIHMGWYCNVIAVDPADPDRVWAAGVDLFRSDDGGQSWGIGSYWWLDPGDPDYVHADQHAIAFHPEFDGDTNQTMFTASDGGIFRCDNARGAVTNHLLAICNPSLSTIEWTSLNHNLGITQFYHGLPYPGGERFIGGTQDNGTIAGAVAAGDDGWYEVFGGDGGYVAVDPAEPDTMYVEYQWSRIQKSTDGGSTFVDARNGITDSTSRFLFITPFVMDPGDRKTLWLGGRRMWRTTDGAGLWTAASTSFADGGMTSAIAVSPGDSNLVFAGTTAGHIARATEALAADSATSWPSARPRDAYVSWLTFDPHHESTLWATYAEFGGPHVYRSSDRGVTWEARDGSGSHALPDIPVHSIVIDPVLRGRIFLGTDLGVFTSTNDGASWHVENTGFATAVTEALSLGTDASGRPMLYAFTHGRGAWRVPLRSGPPAPRRSGGGHKP